MTTIKTLLRPIAASAVIVAAGASVAWGIQTGADPAEVSAQPDISFREPAVSWSGEQLVKRAALFTSSVPLPTGGNFNGIRWTDLEAATDTDIRFLLQYNAACQWLRAAADRRDAANQDAIWSQLPTWPAMRLDGYGEQFQSARAPALQGRDSALSRRCVESHERETSYARGLGLTPSS